MWMIRYSNWTRVQWWSKYSMMIFYWTLIGIIILDMEEGEDSKCSWRLTNEINILSFDIRKIAYFDWENVSFESRCKTKVIQVHDCAHNYEKEYFHSKQEGIIAEELSISNSFYRSNTKIRILIQNNSIESFSIIFLMQSLKNSI